MRLIRLLALLASLPLLSGCVGRDAPPPSTEAPPPLPFDTVLGGVRFEGCVGAAPVSRLPASAVRPYVPAAFEPLGDADFTALVGVEAWRCEEASVGATVRSESVFVAWTFATVRPTTEGWSASDMPSEFVFEALVSDEAIASGLRQTGFPATFAEIEIDDDSAANLALPGQLADGSAWAFVADRLRLEVSLATGHAYDGAHGFGSLALWQGNGPFERTELSLLKWPHGGTGVSVSVEVTGESALNRMTGLPMYQYAEARGQTVFNRSMSFQGPVAVEP